MAGAVQPEASVQAENIFQLNERSQHLLRVLVEHYLKDGQAVGSRTLSRDSGLDLSPATVRNVMADLEDMGLVRAPHTSAGRVPTRQGLRFFVDTLLKVDPLDSLEVKRLHDDLVAHSSVPDILETTSSLLSDLTRLAGVVMLPRRDSLRLRQVEFLPLSERRVLVILVVNDSEVQNRVIHTNRDYTPSELVQAANYLNAEFGGKDLHHARQVLLEQMQATRDTVNRMMQAAVEMAEKALDTGVDDDYLLAGQTNLMAIQDLADTHKLRQLFEAFSEKQQILHLLDAAMHAEGIQIFIGEESGYEVLDDCSVVAAPYQVEGQMVGVLGVIGPTRMAYNRVIPIVDLTARLLGTALHQNA